MVMAVGIAAGCVPAGTLAPSAEADRAVVQLRNEVLAHSRAADWVRDLTDRVGPRLSGSPGGAEAIAWALARMKSLGFANVHAEKVVVPHWVRGVEEGAIVAPVTQRLSLTALGGSVPTPVGGLEAEVVEVPSLEALDALPDAQVRGRIVFFDKMTERTRTGEGYGKAVDVRGEGPVRAAKKGAVGVVIRSIATANTRLPHTGATHYADGVEKVPAAALSVPDAALLHRLLEGGPVRLRVTLSCQSLPDVESADVVGDIVGRERRDEIVLLGAHLDSWDLASGAIDDGAGVGAVLEAARQIGRLSPHPRRTVRVVLFANEENGLRGAAAYAKEHEQQLAHHVVALEVDSGTGSVYAMSYVAGPEAGPLVAAIAAPLRALGIEAPQAGPSHGADLGSLLEAGVPAFGLRQDMTTYFDYHHSADDTFDKVEPAKLAQVAAAVAVVAYGAAEAPADLGRVPESLRARPR